MRYKKIMLFFCLALPICMILRYLQISYTIDATTGFFHNEFKLYGDLLTVAIFVPVILASVFGFFTYRTVQNPTERNWTLRVASGLFAVSVLFETFFGRVSINVRVWQALLLRISGLALAVFLIMYAAGLFIKIKLPTLVAVLPIIYYVMKIICDFTSISSLALISDNVIIIATYCVMLLFMLNFAKFYNDVVNEKASKKLLASGIASIILCFTQSVPYLLVNVTNGFNYSHTSLESNLSIFCAGLFIAAFTFSHFNKKKSDLHL